MYRLMRDCILSGNNARITFRAECTAAGTESKASKFKKCQECTVKSLQAANKDIQQTAEKKEMGRKTNTYLFAQASAMAVLIFGLVVGYNELSNLEVALKLASIGLRWSVMHGAIQLFIRGLADPD